MNIVVNSQRNTAKQWTKRNLTAVPIGICRSTVTLLTVISLFLVYLIISFNSETAPQNPHSHRFRDANLCATDGGEKFLWYSPHSGFSNQLSEFKNGLLVAKILNRTLVVPPVLDHHAVALGSCPKFRVVEPRDIRKSVWEHSLDLMRNGRYISLTDIIDISSVAPHLVRVLDFRDFASMWCNANVDMVCSQGYRDDSPLFTTLKQCGYAASGIGGYSDKCLYAVDDDCRTTVWTYDNGEEDGIKDSFQPDEQLKQKKKISYVRHRRDISKAFGPGSSVDSSKVLAFGSLFTSPYRGSQLLIDIHETLRDVRIETFLKKVRYLPFVPEIIQAGKAFVTERVKAPFFCAQLRLLDGQFKNHWEATFSELRRKLEALNALHPIHIFVMTDLPPGNWSGTYLGDLMSDQERWKIHSLRDDDEFVVKAAKEVSALGRNDCTHKKLPEILLYIEETVCSCATLGFVGTAGSTIAESIELMRKHSACQMAG